MHSAKPEDYILVDVKWTITLQVLCGSPQEEQQVG